jgi:hypothetical protein
MIKRALIAIVGLLVFFIVCIFQLSIQYMISGIDEYDTTDDLPTLVHVAFYTFKNALGEIDPVTSTAWDNKFYNINIYIIWVAFLFINIILLYMVMANILIAQVGGTFS